MNTLSEDDQKFLKRISGSLEMVTAWESDIDLFQEIRSKIPWKELQDDDDDDKKYCNIDKDRLLSDSKNAVFVQRLARWFQDTMTWVNNPPCKECGSKETTLKTVRGPETEEEKEGQAGRVEVYSCPKCDNRDTTTFPRYNRAKKLWETKQGRCGEYANLFGCICRSVGLETRLVLDFSDHVWTEVRLSDTSWHMVDSCEGAFDQPSMYEHGWGKGPKLSYMIGIAYDHVMDVTPRYTRNYMTPDFQMRRRTHTSSEEASVKAIQWLNEQKLQQQTTAWPTAKREEMARRKQLEDAELQFYKQSTEWTEQEKYGRGRISGSLAWKQSRLEAGKQQPITTNNKDDNETKENETKTVAGFEVEAFCPPPSTTATTVSLTVHPHPKHHHDGIVVANVPCAVGESDSISVVVVDEAYLGCILQSRSFLTFPDVKAFINRLPSNRIVIMNGRCKQVEDNDNDAKKQSAKNATTTTTTNFDMPRLGGWNGNDDVLSKGILFIGQVDAHPDWAFCNTLDGEIAKDGYVVELEASSSSSSRQQLRLRTEKQTLPQRVAGRLPESVMPLRTQLLASDQQKHMAFASFCPPPPSTAAANNNNNNNNNNNSRYCGYTTKPNCPVYLLDSTSYPLSRMDVTTVEAVSKENVWNSFHYLPSPLVPEDDHGIVPTTAATTAPKYDVPVDSGFFRQSIGDQLVGQNGTRLPTVDALHNARLIGLYFSAHWCGPCRQFTPMLAEMYAHLKEERPTHGLEIVFVSSDRDPNSFQGYFHSMPWLAIPFESLQVYKPALSMAYGVRGIPALVVLDAVSGQVVISAQESRQEVAMACRGGEASIEAMLDSWLARTPQDTREILSMLELSCQDEADSKKADEKDNPYLIGEVHQEPKQIDLAAEVKRIFEKLVAEGSDPNAAAAKAIALAAEEQKKGKTLEVGPLNGKAVRAGPPTTENGYTLDEAFANALVWNSPAAVSTLLTTALKYVRNANKEPWSPKFRTLKLSNKVADKITGVDGGLKLLQCLGFEVFPTSQDFKATIPVNVDLDYMIATVNTLLEGLADS